jgi:hypothetical protein
MEDVIARYIGDMYGRVSGPLSFRLILQPAMAAFFAIRGGWRDGLAGRPPYFWHILRSHTHRWDLVREGWKDIAKVFVMALVIDAIYQAIAIRWFYPVESIDVAITLAILPYVLIRGPVGYFTRRWQSRPQR